MNEQNNYQQPVEQNFQQGNQQPPTAAPQPASSHADFSSYAYLSRTHSPFPSALGIM